MSEDANHDFEVNPVTGSVNGQMQDYSRIEKYKMHMLTYMPGFLVDIDRMNGMYRMPEVEKSWQAADTRLNQFRNILQEEVDELDDIYKLLGTANDDNHFEVQTKVEVALADLLGDIIVYCASEARRWDIPIDRVLHIIMQSNFSKLDEDGQPIYDERMKLLKGPNYWKPEPKIEQLLIEWNGRSNV